MAVMTGVQVSADVTRCSWSEQHCSAGHCSRSPLNNQLTIVTDHNTECVKFFALAWDNDLLLQHCEAPVSQLIQSSHDDKCEVSVSQQCNKSNNHFHLFCPTTNMLIILMQ